eukprot:11165274-Lingulodinium_polyedra.AAC.1
MARGAASGTLIVVLRRRGYLGARGGLADARTSESFRHDLRGRIGWGCREAKYFDDEMLDMFKSVGEYHKALALSGR